MKTKKLLAIIHACAEAARNGDATEARFEQSCSATDGGVDVRIEVRREPARPAYELPSIT